jgi:predicted RNase H-like HicB family nuclease
MAEPISTLYIDVQHNTEDEEYGPVYIATNDQIGLVADGKSFEELLQNLREALDACLGEIDTVAAYNLVPHPYVELRMPFAYGETA